MENFKEIKEKHPEIFEKFKKFAPHIITCGAGAMFAIMASSIYTDGKKRATLSALKTSEELTGVYQEYKERVSRNVIDDYERKITKKVNPKRTMNICDKYIDWLPQSSMERIMDSYNESKDQYYD